MNSCLGSDIKCINHIYLDITAVCLNSNCYQKRLCCRNCGQLHYDHRQDLVEVNHLNSFIKQQIEKQVEYPESYTFGQCQLIQGLEQLLNLDDNFQNIVKNEIQKLKQSSIQSYLSQKINNYDEWNEFIFGILQYVKVENGVLTLKKHKEQQLNVIEQQQLSIINSAIENSKEIQPLFIQSFQQKQLKFSQNPIILEGHEAEVTAIEISSDGNLIASGSKDKTVKLWSVKSYSLLQIFETIGEVYGLALSQNNQYLAFGETAGDFSIKLYNLLENGDCSTLKGHQSVISTIHFSENCEYMFSGGCDKQLIIWSLNQKAIYHKFNTNQTINQILSSSDGKLISCICGSAIYIWDFFSKTELVNQQISFASGYGLCSTKDQKIFASCGNNAKITIYKLNNLENNKKSLTLMREFKGADNAIYKIILTSDDKHTISLCNKSKKILIHEIGSGTLIQVLQYGFGQVNRLGGCISLSKDMNMLVSGDEATTIKIWIRK